MNKSMCKSKIKYRELLEEIENFSGVLDSDHSASLYPEGQYSDEYIDYLRDVLDQLVPYNNIFVEIFRGLTKIYGLTEIGEKVESGIDNLTDELIDIHVNLKTLLDVTINTALVITRNSSKSFNVRDRIKQFDGFEELHRLIEEFKDEIHEHDDNRRNEIIHNNRFDDREINDFNFTLHLNTFTTFKVEKDKLAEKFQELLLIKIEEVDNICLSIFESSSKILDELQALTFRIEEELSKKCRLKYFDLDEY